jgi:hypothetical protein
MLSHSKFMRPLGAVTFATLTFFLCSGFAAPQGCDTSNTGSDHLGRDVALASVGVGAVVVGTVVLVHENKVHHNVTGCVYQTPEGLEIRTSDNKSFRLEGDVTTLKQGDMLALGGQRVKRDKHSPGDQVFEVAKLKKDKGPCTVPSPVTPPTPAEY